MAFRNRCPLHVRQRADKLSERLSQLLLRQMVISVMTEKEAKQSPLVLVNKAFVRIRLIRRESFQLMLVLRHTEANTATNQRRLHRVSVLRVKVAGFSDYFVARPPHFVEVLSCSRDRTQKRHSAASSCAVSQRHILLIAGPMWRPHVRAQFRPEHRMWCPSEWRSEHVNHSS